MGQARPGQPLRISSQTWNAVERLVGDRPAAGYAPPIGFSANDGSILIRNSSGEDRKRFEVLALRQPKYQAEETATQQPYYWGYAPSYPDDMGAIAVLQEPIRSAGVGRALVSGITPVRFVYDPDDDEYGPFADFQDGEFYLRSRPMGGARIMHTLPFTGGEPVLIPVMLGTLYLPTYRCNSGWGENETKSNVVVEGAKFKSVSGNMVRGTLGLTQLIISTFFRQAEGLVTNAVGCEE